MTAVAPAYGAVLMGRWDTDGDGAVEDVYNDGSSIRVSEANGGGRSYFIGPNWFLVTARDTNGEPGVELVFNLGSSVRIVKDASRTAQDYFVAPNWVFFVAADTDGHAGEELVFNVLGRLRIIHDAAGVVSDYGLIAQTFVFMGAASTDAVAGNELLFNLGTTVRIFHEASGGTITDRFVGLASWALMDIVDTDGCSGDELVFNLSGTVRIIRDADGTSVSRTVSVPWTYLGASQKDALPGLDLSFNTFGNVIQTVYDGRCGAEAPTMVATPTVSPTITPLAISSPTASATRQPATSTPTGTPLPTGLSISGHVLYAGSGLPLAAADVAIDGVARVSVQTGPSGSYSADGLASGAYQVRVRQHAMSGGAVTATDATCALQASLGLRQLNLVQWLATDVTGDGTVSSLDAARILQRAAGSISALSIVQACDSDLLALSLVRTPGTAVRLLRDGLCELPALAFLPLTTSAVDADFEAAYFGDCTLTND